MRSYLQRVAKVPTSGAIRLAPRKVPFSPRLAPEPPVTPAVVSPATPPIQPSPQLSTAKGKRAPLVAPPSILPPRAEPRIAEPKIAEPRKVHAPEGPLRPKAAREKPTVVVQKGIAPRVPPAPSTPQPLQPKIAAPPTTSARVSEHTETRIIEREIVREQLRVIESKTAHTVLQQITPPPTVRPVMPVPPPPAQPRPNVTASAPPSKPRVEIGTIEVHVSAPPAPQRSQRPTPRASRRAPVKTSLARGYFHPFGLSQS